MWWSVLTGSRCAAQVVVMRRNRQVRGTWESAVDERRQSLHVLKEGVRHMHGEATEAVSSCNK